MVVYRDLAYHEAPDARGLDLWVGPPGGPLVVFVHGGGWRDGSPADGEPLARVLVETGCSVACVGYRLAPAWRWPTPFEDVVAAVAWLVAQSQRHGADPTRLVLGGHSAGGQLACLLALTAPPPGLCGVFALSGVFDLLRGARTTWMNRELIRPTFGEDLELLRQASPLHRVERALPPVWLHNAQVDWGLAGESARFDAALTAVGTRVRRTVARDRHHLTVVSQVGTPGDETTAWLREFIQQVR